MLLAYADRARLDLQASHLCSFISGGLGFPVEDFSIKSFFPDNFLILCRSQSARDAILAASGQPMHSEAVWFFRPWTRLAYASIGVLGYRLFIAFQDVPPHTWSVSTAQLLLRCHCWVERLDDDTAIAERSDLATFRVVVWCDWPQNIPSEVTMEVIEPDCAFRYEDPLLQQIFGNLPPYTMEKRKLRFSVTIRLVSLVQFRPLSSSNNGSVPSVDGDGDGPTASGLSRSGIPHGRQMSFLPLPDTVVERPPPLAGGRGHGVRWADGVLYPSSAFVPISFGSFSGAATKGRFPHLSPPAVATSVLS